MAIKYFLGEGRDGVSGEIPGIFIDQEEALLPVNKLYEAKISFLSDTIEESKIVLIWWVGKEEIFVKAGCRLNDERLKGQLKENAELAEKLIKWVVECKSSLTRKKEELCINEKVPEADIFEELKPYVTQVEKWKKFISAVNKNGGLNLRYGSRIGDDDFYNLVIHRDALFIPEVDNYRRFLLDNIPDEELDAEFSVFPTLFRFNSKKHPPRVDEKSISWELPKKKVRIILPHHFTTKEVVAYYGYEEMYQKFLKDREATRIADSERSKAWSEISEAEKKESKEKLRKILLS